MILLEFTCGACDALDDFTSYLTPNKLEDLYAMIDGNFVGLGIELKHDKEGLRVVGVIRGGPAWEAGLQAGDTIVKVNGKSIKGMGLDESANKLQGTEGSTIELASGRRTARRQVSPRPPPRRGRERHAGEGRGPGGRIGYLRLAGFQKCSTEEIDAASPRSAAGDAIPGDRPARQSGRPPERGG